MAEFYKKRSFVPKSIGDLDLRVVLFCIEPDSARGNIATEQKEDQVRLMAATKHSTGGRGGRRVQASHYSAIFSAWLSA